MNFNLFFSDDLSTKHKCINCQNYLSCFPVYTVGEEGSICGRCPPPENETHFRNEIYEMIGQHLKFPCQYTKEGCIQQLLPKDILHHEKKCFFKIVGCPGRKFTDCKVKGSRTGMLSHCRLSHEDVFINDKPFDVDLNQSTNFQRFLEYAEKLFVVSATYVSDSRTFTCVIYNADEVIGVENCKYQIVFSTENLHMTGQGIASNFDKQQECVMDLNSFKSSSVVGKIIFEQNLNYDLLSMLTCSACSEYVLPPVLQFNDKIKCDDCIRISEKFGSGLRNVSLDNIAKRLDYPCKYKKIGCKVVLKPEKMRKHLLICPFESDFCPLRDYVDCDWLSTRKQLKEHIRTVHFDLIVENDKEISVSQDLVWKFSVVRFGEFFFRLKFCKYNDAKEESVVYKWVVHTIGYVEENFKYEIEIEDVRRDDRLVMRRRCLPFSERGVFSDYKEDPCLYHGSEIFPKKGDIKFKIRIFQQ